ncbi:hypothetical protein K7432_003809 [Basidiobolus ranarum]|uniref:Defect at low temperature protein 1 n=1 Tax=Basidiobolus ranarum TaxID=34480 RepID=A0ABR2WZ97_9FUNG
MKQDEDIQLRDGRSEVSYMERRGRNKMTCGARLYVATLFCFVAITGAFLLFSAYDFFFQAVRRTKNISYVLVVGGSYLLLGLVASIFGFSRLLSIRAAINDMPKLYVPIKKEDLPKKVYHFVTSEFERIRKIQQQLEPLPNKCKQPGWGQIGTVYEDIHFKTSVVRTLGFIDQAVFRISPSLARPENITVSQYMEFLSHHGYVDKRITEAYADGYERARFGEDEWSEEEYTDFMKLVSLLLSTLGYQSDLESDQQSINTMQTRMSL